MISFFNIPNSITESFSTTNNVDARRVYVASIRILFRSRSEGSARNVFPIGRVYNSTC